MTKKQKPTLHVINGNRANYEYEQAKKLVQAVLVDNDMEKA